MTGLLLAKGFAYLGQPPVIGEVIAGIVLGPSLLGADASAILLPPTVAPFLGVIAQLGVLLYMFTVGLEIHTDLMRQRTHAIVAISHTSILVPFVLGALLALELYPRIISLPLYPAMTEEQVDYVTHSVRDVVESSRSVRLIPARSPRRVQKGRQYEKQSTDRPAA